MSGEIETKKIEGKDEHGNKWKITLERLPSKSNRYKLSIFFNAKEYVVSRYQTRSGALDSWELIETLSKKTVNSAPVSSELFETLSKK